MGRNREFDEATAVDAAGTLFGRYGFEGTSVDDLVQHLGVHRGSLYRTFGSKLELYHLALRRQLEQQVLPWIGSLGDAGADPFVGSLQTLLSPARSVDDADDDALALLLRAAVESAPTDERAAEQVGRVCAALESRLAQRYGAALAPALVATVLGLHVMARADVVSDPEESARTLAATLRAAENAESTQTG